MDLINHIDQVLFYWINNKMDNLIFDYLFIFIRNKYVWLPLYLFIISFLIFNFKKKGLLILTFAFITVGAADFISSGIIKPAVQRVRPCNDTGGNLHIIKRVNCGSGYSFPSSHATNHFALGIFFFLIFFFINKYLASLFILWAFLISFAQIYVGVHYPLDVFSGAILGSLTGFSIYKIYKNLENRIFYKKKQNH
jgi:undecaprenyl-diphosphatase